MHLEYRNVNEAFYALVRGILTGDIPTIKTSSRNGPVLQVDEPVIVTYSHPTERVLFNGARDANPFFHLYEALWMLAGRNDVAPLNYFVKDFGSRFSDDGKTMNGAYGYRWRHTTKFEDTSFVPEYGGKGLKAYSQVEDGVDQLDLLVAHLKAQPDSRRAVLQMWNVEDDLLKLGERKLVHTDGGACHGTPLVNGRCPKCGITPDTQSTEIWPIGMSKDVCCNLSVMFSIRSNKCVLNTGPIEVLDMTVTNRSNDMIWGMLGANYVHFTFLQEYMAARLGVAVGKYHHMTNNLHVYENTWKPSEWLRWYDENSRGQGDLLSDAEWYPKKTVPFVKDASLIDTEIKEVVRVHDMNEKWVKTGHWSEPFIKTVAYPALCAHVRYKELGIDGCDMDDVNQSLSEIDDLAWQTACTDWITRRLKRKAAHGNERGSA